MSDLQTIFPGKDIQISGQTVTVKPFTFGQLPKVMKLINKLSAVQTGSGNIDTNMLLGLLAEGSDDLVDLIASSSGLSAQTINLLQPDEGIELLAAFLEVNGDFFVQKVLPIIKKLVEKHLTGPKSSSNSKK